MSAYPLSFRRRSPANGRWRLGALLGWPAVLSAQTGKPAPVAAFGGEEWLLVAALLVAAGTGAWFVRRHARRQATRDARQLSSVLEFADCLLWQANVELPTWTWQFTMQPTGLSRRLYEGLEMGANGGLWPMDCAPDLAEMDARCRAALAGGEAGYEQQFRFIKGGRTLWLRESVAITPTGPGRFWLVGIVTEITALRELELGREASERALREVLTRADCLVWEGIVDYFPDGRWTWNFTIHPSGLSMTLFGVPVPPKSAGLWRQFAIPERQEMNQRCKDALQSGQPGYEQEFHIVREEGAPVWLHESVSVKQIGPQRFSLVGVATDVTVQHLAEEARQASERALREILERADCLLWRACVVRENGTFRWTDFEVPASRLHLEVLGAGPKCSPKQLWNRDTAPELAEMDARSQQALLTGAPGYEQEFRAVQGARTFWLHERVSIEPLGADQWRIVGVVTDITARRAAEEAQRRSEARLEELLRRADCLIWQGTVKLSPEGELKWQVYVPRSQLHRKIFGRDPRGTSFGWREIGVPELPEMEARARLAILSDTAGYEQLFHVPKPEGDVWLSEQVSISRVGPAEWEVIGVIMDITERRKAEEAQRATEAQLQQILERADCMVWEATTTETQDGRIEWRLFTPRSVLYRRLFGESEEGRTLDWRRLNVPETAEMERRAAEAIRGETPGYEQEFRVILHDRGLVWLREVVTISRIKPGQTRLVGVITDITAQREAQEAQKASQAQVEQMLATVDCLLWQARVFQLGPRELRWVQFVPRSRLYREIFGTDPADPQNLGWKEVVDAATDREIEARAMNAVVSGLPGYEQDFRAQRGGRVFWLHEQVTISQAGPGEWKLVGVITDLAARRTAEQAVRESELRYRTLFQHMPVAIVEADFSEVGRWLEELRAGGVTDIGAYVTAEPRRLYHAGKLVRVVDCNAAAIEVLHAKTKSDFRRRRGLIVTPDSLRVVKELLEALWEGRNALESEIDVKDFVGGLHNMNVRWWMERTERGLDLRQSVMVFVDYTELRRAEAALAAEKERLAVTLRAMAEGVITTDVHGCVQYMNPAALAFTHTELHEAIGRPVTEVCRFESDRTGAAVELPVTQVAQRDVVLDLPVQTRLAVRGGASRLVEGCCAPIHAADSKVIGAVLVFRDVTERERLEQELVRASKLESVGILAGGIAHDFNNILTAIMGNVALALLDVEPGTEVARSLGEAEKATLRARDLTQQLLTFAKGGDPVRTSVRLDGIVREMTAFTLHGARVKAAFDIAEDLWPADADKAQIGRVVQNLVLNAVQAMPEGGTVHVTMRNERIDALAPSSLVPGDYVLLEIADTGIGIAPEHLPRIFDPYFTTKQSGSGLGLAAVYSIVNKHHGKIDVVSQLGQGTTFSIWLPAQQGGAVEVVEAMPAVRKASFKGRVLFMDDEESIRQMASFLLKRLGFEVECVPDGAEAVKRYAEEKKAGSPYALVIMDLTVPGGMGGREAMVRLREIDPHVKAIVSSGYSSDPVLANYRDYGFRGVAAKPYEVADLARVLRDVLAGDDGEGI